MRASFHTSICLSTTIVLTNDHQGMKSTTEALTEEKEGGEDVRGVDKTADAKGDDSDIVVASGIKTGMDEGEEASKAKRQECAYVYRDFATIPAPTMGLEASLHPQSLHAQKLPAKLASILNDQGKCHTKCKRHNLWWK